MFSDTARNLQGGTGRYICNVYWDNVQPHYRVLCYQACQAYQQSRMKKRGCSTYSDALLFMIFVGEGDTNRQAGCYNSDAEKRGLANGSRPSAGC